MSNQLYESEDDEMEEVMKVYVDTFSAALDEVNHIISAAIKSITKKRK